MLNPLLNPTATLPPLIAMAVNVFLVIFTFRKARWSLANIMFVVFLIFVLIWDFLLFGINVSSDLSQTQILTKASIAFQFAIFVLFYHFIFIYTKPSRQRPLLLISYLSLLAIAAISQTSLLLEGFHLADNGYIPNETWLAMAFEGFGLILMMVAVFNLLFLYRIISSNDGKNKAMNLNIGILILVIGNLLNDITSSSLPAIVGNLILCVISTVAIVGEKLANLDTLITKTSRFLLGSAGFSVPYVATFFLITYFLQDYLLWWQYIIMVLGLSLFFRYFYGRVGQAEVIKNAVGKIFYRGRYNYLEALDEFIKGSQAVTDVQELTSTTVDLIRGAFHTSNVCLILSAQDASGFDVVSSVGLDNPPHGVILKPGSMLVWWLENNQRALTSDELDIIPSLQSITTDERRNLEELNARLFLPIHNGQRLLGAIVLGKKLSNEAYTEEEKRFLSILIRQLSVTLDRALAYTSAFEARESLEKWLNAMGDYVIIADNAWRVQFANRSAIEKLGVELGGKCWESLGMNSQCPFCPSHAPLFTQNASNYIVIKDRGYEVSSASLTNLDGSQSIIEVFRDVTERKRAEQMVLESEQKANVAKTEFLRRISHQLRTPLNSVMGFTELMLDSVPGDINQEQRECLNDILKGARTLLSIVNDTLDLSKVEAGKVELKISSINIEELIDEVIRTVQSLLNEKGHKMEIVAEAGLPQVAADKERLSQVITNLLSNSIKFTPQGGEISIEVHKDDGQFCKVSVIDTGIGIRKEDQEFIFEPFFQADTGLKNNPQGTGLGLKIAKHYIELLGGRIWFNSEQGKGTKFTFTIPTVSNT